MFVVQVNLTPICGSRKWQYCNSKFTRNS